MSQGFVFLVASLMASSSFAANAYLTSIKSYKNGSFRGESKLITSTSIAESRQGDDTNYVSNSVQFLPDASSAESMIFRLKIQEQKPEASFTLNKSFKISKAGALTNFEHKSGKDTYLYQITITPE